MPVPARKSLRRRLPLLFALAIGIAVVAFGAIAYGALRRTLITTASLRLRTVAERFAQSSATALDRRVGAMRALARDPAVTEALSGGDSVAASRVLARLGPDTGAMVAVGLRDAAGRTVLSGRNLLRLEGRPVPADQPISPLFARGDSVEFLIRAPVVVGDSIVGEVVQVRLVRSTPNALKTLNDLIGAEATLMVGNADGSLWTDLRRLVSLPSPGDSVTRYVRRDRKRLLGMAELAGSPLVFAVDQPMDRVLMPARSLVLRFAALAVLIIVVGTLLTWLASRRITGPLTDLTRATVAVAKGGTSVIPVPVDRDDEIGALARAFSIMARSVFRSREELERQVAERTQALEDARDELVRKERLAMLGQFAGGVSHELRNPLSVMGVAVYSLEALVVDPSPKVREYLGVMQQQIQLVDKIVADMLDFVRIRPAERMPMDLGPFIEAQLARVEIPPSLEVRRDLDPAPAAVYADPIQIGQVLFNVLTNAVQAMEGVGCLTIRTRGMNDRVWLEIEDTGPGVPPGDRDRIFEPLFTTKRFGFGLGLAVSRSLARANGGELSVVSAEGRGAAFRLDLPAARPPSTAHRVSEAAVGRV